MAFKIVYALSCWAVANVDLETTNRLHHKVVIPMGFEPVVITHTNRGVYASRNTRDTVVMNRGEVQTLILVRR